MCRDLLTSGLQKAPKTFFFHSLFLCSWQKIALKCLQNIPQDVHFPLFPRHRYIGKRSERWAELIKHSNRKLLALSAVPAKQALILRVPRNKCSSFDKSLNLGLWLWQTFIPGKISVGGGVREADLIAPAVWFTILGTVQWAICVFWKVISFPTAVTEHGVTCKEKEGGAHRRPECCRRKRTGVVNNTDEQQSSRAEQSCRLSCSAVTPGNGHREESCLHY